MHRTASTDAFVVAAGLRPTRQRRASVWRRCTEACRALAAAGAIDLVRHPDGEIRYRRCTTRGHHHLVCLQCGSVVEISAPAVDEWVEGLARAHDFGQVRHTIEMFGPCPSCHGPE